MGKIQCCRCQQKIETFKQKLAGQYFCYDCILKEKKEAVCCVCKKQIEDIENAVKVFESGNNIFVYVCENCKYR